MDVLEFTENVPAALALIKQAVANGHLSQASLDERCLKVLRAKAWVGLDQYKPVVLDNLVSDLNAVQDNLLNRKLTESSLTVLKNERIAPEPEPAAPATVGYASDSLRSGGER